MLRDGGVRSSPMWRRGRKQEAVRSRHGVSFGTSNPQDTDLRTHAHRVRALRGPIAAENFLCAENVRKIRAINPNKLRFRFLSQLFRL